MNLSRRDSRRKTPVITWKLGVWLIFSLMAILIAFAMWYVREAGSDYAREEREAVRRTMQEAGLVSVEWAFRHAWDDSVWVVLGTDGEGVRWMVWETPDGYIRERESDLVGEAELRAMIRNDEPGRKILRVVPGWFQGEPVWEVRYIADSEEGRQAIDFYSARDGAKRKTYDLPGL
jgi:uncharacterized protein YpmB